MADLTRHVLVDANIWTGPSGSEYRDNCNDEDVKCLSLTGWFITFGCTWTGFILLFAGTLWNANILVKLKAIYAQCVTVCTRRKRRAPINEPSSS